MKPTRDALEALIAGLSGRLLVTADWQAVIALANHTLLTPVLFATLAHTGQLDRLPEDVGQYLQFIYRCNRERNLRLRRQLNEAVAALNQGGVVPVLLKGAVPLFLSSSGRVPDRIMSDLDLAVETAKEGTARACLAKLGYVEVAVAGGMARPQDVGLLELRPYREIDRESPRLARRHGLRAKIPAPQSRALHWIMHDLIKEADYWRGRTDFRHLYDLARLAEQHKLDWAVLRTSLPDQSARNAFDTQLLALSHFFGVRAPAQYVRRPLVRFQHWRRVFPLYHPVLGVPLRLVGNSLWGMWRLLHGDGLGRRSPLDFGRRATSILLDGDLGSKV
ncbi:nucleotidyltransferase family protein [Mesorhizobium sp. M1312]|uniref:nucleotidyltransferase family protein n=1 Tax=unclassified Mesorhizobium TaxID=325217 RepID=UPI00333A7447